MDLNTKFEFEMEKNVLVANEIQEKLENIKKLSILIN